jgi:hypothetical protein
VQHGSGSSCQRWTRLRGRIPHEADPRLGLPITAVERDVGGANKLRPRFRLLAPVSVPLINGNDCIDWSGFAAARSALRSGPSGWRAPPSFHPASLRFRLRFLSHPPDWTRATRKPIASLRAPGGPPSRDADRQYRGDVRQPPPRATRTAAWKWPSGSAAGDFL